MAHYVDGFIIPIKKSNLKAYKKMATLGRKVWMEHGAISYYECVGDEIGGKMGIPFTKLCKLKPNETVIFAFVVYESKAARNRISKLVHQDPRMSPDNPKNKGFKMPFDMKRFTVGVFKTLVRS